MRSVSIGHLNRYRVGSLHDSGAFACASAVMERCRRAIETRVPVCVFVSEAGDVFAPAFDTQVAQHAMGARPRWLVGTCLLPGAQARDVADDIRFHVDQVKKVKKAA